MVVAKFGFARRFLHRFVRPGGSGCSSLLEEFT
jgi:hypothetical protein